MPRRHNTIPPFLDNESQQRFRQIEILRCSDEVRRVARVWDSLKVNCHELVPLKGWPRRFPLALVALVRFPAPGRSG